MNTRRVPVISKDGTVLIPMYWSRAKKLVDDKRAIFVKVSHKNKSLLKNKLESEKKIYPNTKITKDNGFIVYLKLKYNPKNVDIEKNRREQPFVLGFDSGNVYNGLCIVSKLDNVNYQFISKNSLRNGEQKIKSKIEKRRDYRKQRKQRKPMFSKMRENNRLKLTATTHHKNEEQLHWIGKLIKYYPISDFSYERFNFNSKNLCRKQKILFSQISQGINHFRNKLEKNFPYLKISSIRGYHTYENRNKLGLYKNTSKNILNFNSHCVDAYVIALTKLKELKPTYHCEIWKPVRFIIPVIYYGDGRRCLRRITNNNSKIISRGKVIKGGVLVNRNSYTVSRKTFYKKEYTRNNHLPNDKKVYFMTKSILKVKRRIDKLNGTKILTYGTRKYCKTNYIGSHKNMLCTSSKKNGKYVGFVRSYCFNN